MLRTRKVEYFYSTAADRLGTSSSMLACLANHRINLTAFNAIPAGPSHTMCTLFPEDSDRLIEVAEKEGLTLEGPHHALLVEGEDRIGALDGVFQVLYDASIDVYSASAIGSRQGYFGCLLYVRPAEIDRALGALGALDG